MENDCFSNAHSSHRQKTRTDSKALKHSAQIKVALSIIQRDWESNPSSTTSSSPLHFFSAKEGGPLCWLLLGCDNGWNKWKLLFSPPSWMSVAVSGPRSLYYEICNIRESCPISGCTTEFFFLFVFPVVKWQKRAPARKIPKGYGLTFATFLPPPIRCYLP